MKRLTAVVAVESRADGSLSFVANPIDAARIAIARVAFTVEAWPEGEGVRLRFRNPATGDIAYLQGGAPLLAFAAALLGLNS